ncbi:MAG: GNAT family N-acetyltransferase, partial [Pseudomonadota bacterium]
MSIEIKTLKGPEAEGVLDAVSQLRITVFRDWPYLYDGNADYERDYLAAFAQAADAVVVVARDTSLSGTGAIRSE